MDTPTFTTEDVAELLRVLLERPASINGEDVFTLEQVAEKTKISLRFLERNCRADVLEHIHVGNLRGMTRVQIAKMVERYRRGGDLARTGLARDDELEQARYATRKSGASRRGRAA